MLMTNRVDVLCSSGWSGMLLSESEGKLLGGRGVEEAVECLRGGIVGSRLTTSLHVSWA